MHLFPQWPRLLPSTQGSALPASVEIIHLPLRILPAAAIMSVTKTTKGLQGLQVGFAELTWAEAGTTLSLTPNAIDLPEDEWKELWTRSANPVPNAQKKYIIKSIWYVIICDMYISFYYVLLSFIHIYIYRYIMCACVCVCMCVCACVFVFCVCVCLCVCEAR